MLQFVLKGIPDNLKKNLSNNIESFQNLHKEEKKIRNLAKRNQISFICRVEQIKSSCNKNKVSHLDRDVRNCVLNIYNNLPIPLKRGKRSFISSLTDTNSILITLRVKKEQRSCLNNNQDNKKNETKNLANILEDKEGIIYENEAIVGYVKGGPIEKYNLRRGTFDENYGKRNTVHMEWICIRPGYWGTSGGHLLRMNFLQEAKKRGYNFITGYVHRDVIMKRINKGEIIQIVQKYNPDKLDYYRIDLNTISLASTSAEDLDEFATAVYP